MKWSPTSSWLSVRGVAAAVAFGMATGTGGCTDDDGTFTLGGSRYSARSLVQWKLPGSLREISGLALDDAGRLFAHGDERAVVFQLDYHGGGITRRFAFGEPAVEGDFEGIAWGEGKLHLVTSDGIIVSGEPGDDGAHVPYQRVDTGFGKRCEIEGLYFDPRQRVLYMACKTARERALENVVAILAWSVARGQPAPELDVHVAVRRGPWGGELNPSGLTRSPRNGHFLLVAARQYALLEVADDGRLVGLSIITDRRPHRQMEGIEVTPAGELIIADEGRGKRGRLGVYAAQR